MFEMSVPETFRDLQEMVVQFATVRRRKKDELRQSRPKRRALSPTDRSRVFEKTEGRCHVCGGSVDGAWQADHVMAHSRAGAHSVENYLPAHRLCNNYRWDYEPEEFQLILKLGVWARTQIERGTRRGVDIGEGFLAHEMRRVKRRRDRDRSKG